MHAALLLRKSSWTFQCTISWSATISRLRTFLQILFVILALVFRLTKHSRLCSKTAFACARAPGRNLAKLLVASWRHRTGRKTRFYQKETLFLRGQKKTSWIESRWRLTFRGSNTLKSCILQASFLVYSLGKAHFHKTPGKQKNEFTNYPTFAVLCWFAKGLTFSGLEKKPF